MINILNDHLKIIDVIIVENKINIEFSDYLMYHNDDIIGFGWKSNNNLSKGFMGLCKPNDDGLDHQFTGEISSKILLKLNDDLDFVKSMFLFQFAISEDKYWFSPPTANLIDGMVCPPQINSGILLKYLKKYIINKDTLPNSDFETSLYKAVDEFKKEINLL